MLLLAWDVPPALETVAALAINHVQMDALVVVADAPADVLVPALIHVDLDAQHLRKHKGGERKGLVRLAEPVAQQVARLRHQEIVAVAEPVAHTTAAQYVQDHVQISAQDAWGAAMMSAYIHAQQHAQKTVRRIAR